MGDLTTGRNVASFADRAGLDAAEVVSASPVADSRTRRVSLRGQSLLLGDWSLRSRRRCPVCVEEDRAEAGRRNLPAAWWATSRLWWDVRSIDACPIHRVRMVDHCAACGVVQTWCRGLLSCACGAEHGLGSAAAADASVSSYLIGRLAGAPVVHVPVLNGMSFADAVRTIELLGAARLDRRAVKPRRFGRHMIEDRRVGLALAMDWPRGFDAVLDRLVATREVGTPDGLLAAYGWVYSEICVGDAPRCIAELVGPVLRDHAVAHGVIARDEERLGATPPPTITATAAARLIGCSYATTRRMLEAADAIPEGSRRGVAFALNSSEVARLQCRRPVEPPGHRLGVGRKQARGLLKLAAGEATLAAERSEAVNDWLRRLRKRAGRTSSGLLVSLPTACRNMSVPLVDACSAIEAGRLHFQWRSTGAVGLQAVMVDQSDLATLRPSCDKMSISEVARRYHLHRDAVVHLARIGEFGPRFENGAVDAGAVKAFFAEHGTASSIARRRGTSSRKLGTILAEAGVMPAFGPPACRQLLYRIDDLPALH